MKPLRPFEPFVITQAFNNASDYGPHEGVDYNVLGTSGNMDCGTPYRAVADGEIIHFSELNKNYGNLIVLNVKTVNGDRYVRYCHCEEILVKSGFVKRGDVIGKMGSTGNSTACHLHFDVLTKIPTNWRYYTKAINNWFEDPEVFFNTDLAIVGVMDPFKEKGIAALDKYRGERVQGPEGNYESYAAAVIASDKAVPGFNETIIDRDKKIHTLTNQVEAANTTIEVKDKAIDSLKEQLKITEAKLKEITDKPPVINPTPLFKNPVAGFFYKLALWAEA